MKPVLPPILILHIAQNYQINTSEASQSRFILKSK
jgi:hypothetical protein